MRIPMNYQESIEYIEKSAARGSILGFKRIEVLCRLLGNPEKDLRIIHVAGTNGKGSTSAFIASILTKVGYRTGMYYSPAMTGIKDHYAINNVLISDEDYAEMVTKVADCNDSLHNIIGEYATQFELETAIAFLYFKERGCDAVVLETGLGGRDDATNIVDDKLLCVLTSISLDHTAILGDSIYEIAEIKSGIIKNGCRVVAFDSTEEATRAIVNACDSQGSKLTIVKDSDYTVGKEATDDFLHVSCCGFDSIPIGLNGYYQGQNAALAIYAARALADEGLSICDDDIISGLRDAYWPFRFEAISKEPLVIVDGAHNPGAVDKLYDTVVKEYSDKAIILVIGMFKDKDYSYVISKMASLASSIYTVTVPNEQRALAGKEIASIASNCCKDVYECSSITDGAVLAYKKAQMVKHDNKDACVIAYGSLSYLSIFKEAIREWKESTI